MDQGQLSVKNLLYVGGNGYLKTFDCGGQEPRLLWTTDLECGRVHVSCLGHLNHVYVGCGGSVFQVEAKTGKIIWTKKLSRGFGAHVTMALNGSFLLCGVFGYVSAVDKDAGQSPLLPFHP